MLLCGGHHLAVSSFYNGRRPLCLLFCDQKSSRKVPLVPRRGARLRGCSPLRTPKRRSKDPKAKKCRSAAFFLTLLCPSPDWPLRGRNGASRTPPPPSGLLRFYGRTMCARRIWRNHITARANTVRPYSLYTLMFWPRRGQCGKRKKSVKKNAALLHFLGFFSLTLLFGVPRGE